MFKHLLQKELEVFFLLPDDSLCVVEADEELVACVLCLLAPFELVGEFRLLVVVEEVDDGISQIFLGCSLLRVFVDLIL